MLQPLRFPKSDPNMGFERSLQKVKLKFGTPRETFMKFYAKISVQIALATMMVAFSVQQGQAGLPSSSGASPLGDWSRGDGQARVRIEVCGQDLCAINTWIRPDNVNEKVGDKLIMTIHEQGDVYSGEAFDPQRHLTYRLVLTVSSDTMSTRGCILGGLICKRTDWKRISPL